MLSLRTAEYCGLDSIYVAAPEKIINRIAFISPYTTIIPLSDLKITHGIVRKILRLIERRKIVIDTVLIGPGLTGIGKEIAALIYNLSKMDINVVIDSGAIYPETVKLVKFKNVIYAPKVGELRIILGEEYSRDVISSLSKYKSDYVILVKDYMQYIVYDGSEAYVIKSDKYTVTKHGLFYILTGLLSGLYAIYKDPVKSAIISVYLVVKTYENIFEKYRLHYTLDEYIMELRSSLKKIIWEGSTD